MTQRRRFRTRGAAARSTSPTSRSTAARSRARASRTSCSRSSSGRARRADAGHRRDDPVRPVPPDHGRAGGRARRPGRPRHRQDRGRPAPRLVAPLHAPRAAAAACSSSARTRRSWTTSRTSCRRSARRPSSSAPSRSWSTGSRPPRGGARRRAAEGATRGCARWSRARSSSRCSRRPRSSCRALDGRRSSRCREREVAALLEEALAVGAALGRARASGSGWPCCAASTSATASCSAPARCAASTSSSGRCARGGFLDALARPRAAAAAPDRLVARLLTSPSRARRGAGGDPRPTSGRCSCATARRVGDLVWSEHDLPLLDEARTLLGGAAARLRARDRRRGAGPLADAAAHDLAPRGGRLADDPRRRRAGDRARRLPALGGAASRIFRDGGGGRPSRSCATPTASRPRSWSWRCRCSS